MWDFLLVLNSLECTVSVAPAPWPAVLGLYTCGWKLLGEWDPLAVGSDDVCVWLGKLVLPVPWSWQCPSAGGGHTLYTTTLGLSCGSGSCSRKGIFAIVISLDLSSEEEFRFLGTLHPKAQRMSSEAASSLYNMHFM